MTKLEGLQKQYQAAVQRLDEVLRQKKNDFIRDSAIQRFEFTFDLGWKLIKAYLEEKHGLKCASPKECFREAYRQKLIGYSDYWLALTDLRNETTHTYNADKAEEVFAKLPEALSHFQEIEAAMVGK